MKDKQVEYYKRRAYEYEKVYEKIERQSDLASLKEFVFQSSNAKTILEIGCGTGYWTQSISENCLSILATDINESMLEIARRKKYKSPINFRVFNYEDLDELPEGFDQVFAGFVISHIRKENLRDFISRLFSKLDRAGEMILIDNRFVKDSNTPISRLDEFRNSYQTRYLEDGSEYEVLKNFFSREEWEEALAGLGNFTLKEWEYFYAIKIFV